MVNRVIQQKVLKRHRQRRAWAKPFKFASTGPAVLPGFIGDDGKFRSMSMGSRNQAVKTGMGAKDEWLEKVFPDKNPNHDPNVHYVRRLGLHPDLFPSVVVAKLVQSSTGAGTLQGETRFAVSRLRDTERHKLLLLMGGGENFFVERTVHKDQVVYRRSMIYGERVRAMRAFLKDENEPYYGISWVSKTQEPRRTPSSTG